MSIRRSYKYRFYPTPEQKILLGKTFGAVRCDHLEISDNADFDEVSKIIKYYVN